VWWLRLLQVSGFLGMRIATYANARTALEAQSGIRRAFVVAFRSGAVMGFLLPALGLAVLFAIILVYKKVRAATDNGAHSVCRGEKNRWFRAHSLMKLRGDVTHIYRHAQA